MSEMREEKLNAAEISDVQLPQKRIASHVCM